MKIDESEGTNQIGEFVKHQEEIQQEGAAEKGCVNIPETRLLRKTKQRTIQRQRKPDMTLRMITIVKYLVPAENSTSQSVTMLIKETYN